MSDWTKGHLSDLAEIKMGQSPKKEDVNAEGIGFPLLNGPTEFGSNHPIPVQFSNTCRRVAPKDSLLFCVRGSTTGRMNWADQDYGIGRGLASITHKEGVKYKSYLKGLIEYNLPHLLVQATGSTFPNVSRQLINELRVEIPPLPEQKAIAHILGTLDDKIVLNRKMNETLEEMAQALFKSWFVDFDPVLDKALAAGNEIPEPLQVLAEKRKQVPDSKKLIHTNPELAKEFPDRFTFTEELGWIPEGWETYTFDELVDSISDTYPLKDRDKVIFLNTGDILDGKFLHSDYSITKGLPGQAKKSIRKEDILFSEIRPKNKRYAYVDFDGIDHVVSTKLMVLRSTGKIDNLLSYFVITQQSTIDLLQKEAESRSGTFPQITFNSLSKIHLSLPKNQDLPNKFIQNYLLPIFRKSKDNDEQNRTLSKLRDTLLPKLISGELRVPEALKFVEDHG